ncbi:hypothetical protein K8R32_02770 [bacterium]|nr:hypothetical protein [bacterium]
MDTKFLTEQEAINMVGDYMLSEAGLFTTQSILNQNEFPSLHGYVVRHGKVSDCIHGGKGSFVIPKDEENNYRDQLANLPVEFVDFIDHTDKDKAKIRINFKNPPLMVRDIPLILMVRTGRISTHDIERGSIPFKDQILALNHDFMRRMVMTWFGSSQYELGLPANSIVIVAEQVSDMDFENVIRNYMAKSSTVTSLYHAYVNEGQRTFAGHDLPDNLYPNGPTEFLMDTPSTKDDLHDMTVSAQKLFDAGICSPKEYFGLRNNSFAAFGAVAGFFLRRGVILADTKTEHGYNSEGKLVAMDELYTMDSSRLWLNDDYLAQQTLFLARKEDELVAYLKETQPGIEEKDYVVGGRVIMVPRSYSKEFARGFSVEDKKYPPEIRAAIAVRYIMGIQKLLRKRFEPDIRPWHERVIDDLDTALKKLNC